MPDESNELIDVKDLRVGHFVYVDMAWISHPFPVNSFRISSLEQIDTIRRLGLAQLRISREKSDPQLFRTEEAPIAPAPLSQEEFERQLRRVMLEEQQLSLQACERHFSNAARAFRKISDTVHAQPQSAREEAQAVVDSMLGELLGQNESAIRLLSEKMGERASQHSINVTVLSLLLGKAIGLRDQELSNTGLSALLHDIGKIELPDRLRFGADATNAAEMNLYQDHVVHGIGLGRKMGLAPPVLLGIAQHHEYSDGSGYPQQLTNERLTAASRVIALVNRYDNLCNPANPAHAITPHEALAQIYAQQKTRFDVTVMAAFIRMMGVYPPGSVVQLNDDRYAIVVSVNASRPLKPRIVIFDEAVPRTEALVFDLAADPTLSIRRSLRPLQLPRPAIEYLAPRERICYYFEHARDPREIEDKT